MVMTSLGISRSVRTTILSLGAAALLAAGAGIAGGETGEGKAPKASDVAALRRLLALQYPALRETAATPAVASPAPSVSREADRGEAELPGMEGGGA